jgi:hypothetical protein
VTTTAGLLVLALLPGAAAMTPDAAADGALTPAGGPFALAQVVHTSFTPLSAVSPRVMESLLLAGVGLTLVGLGSVVRRVTSDDTMAV